MVFQNFASKLNKPLNKPDTRKKSSSNNIQGSGRNINPLRNNLAQDSYDNQGDKQNWRNIQQEFDFNNISIISW